MSELLPRDEATNAPSRREPRQDVPPRARHPFDRAPAPAAEARVLDDPAHLAEVMALIGARPVERAQVGPQVPVIDAATLRGPEKAVKHPLYPRLLQLGHIYPSSWQRAVLGEGMAGLGVLLAMADLASAWSIVVLPVAVAVVVKGHDLLAGLLGTTREHLVVLGEDAYLLRDHQLALLQAAPPP